MAGLMVIPFAEMEAPMVLACVPVGFVLTMYGFRSMNFQECMLWLAAAGILFMRRIFTVSLGRRLFLFTGLSILNGDMILDITVLWSRALFSLFHRKP